MPRTHSWTSRPLTVAATRAWPFRCRTPDRSRPFSSASQAGLSEDRVGEVVLAVHELAANAIAHGAGHGRLRIWDLGGTLSCEIVDGGPADAHGAAAAADPWPAVDGHGLWLVRKVADELDLRSGPRGTRAVVTFLVRPGGAGR